MIQTGYQNLTNLWNGSKSKFDTSYGQRQMVIYLFISNCAHIKTSNIKFDDDKNKIHNWWEHQC